MKDWHEASLVYNTRRNKRKTKNTNRKPLGHPRSRWREVALRRVRLVLRWVTDWYVTSRSIQHGHPSVGRRSEYTSESCGVNRLTTRCIIVI